MSTDLCAIPILEERCRFLERRRDALLQENSRLAAEKQEAEQRVAGMERELESARIALAFHRGGKS